MAQFPKLHTQFRVSWLQTIHWGWGRRRKPDNIRQTFRSINTNKACHDASTPHRSIDTGIKPHFLQPHAYYPVYRSWAPLEYNVEGIQRGHILTIASWNLHFSGPGAKARIFAALSHLRRIFGRNTHNTVIMLQEVCQEGLDTFLDNSWVRENFILTDVESPECRYRDDEFLDPDLLPRPFFTLMMVPRVLPVSSCFRVPFRSETRRDALVVDIPIMSGDEDHNQSEGSVLRLCTTHLESMERGNEYRFPQLSIISALLKGKFSQGKLVHAGLVGGDMNAILASEHDYHRAPEVDLRDVWEDEPALKLPVLELSEKDPTFGRARGITWGYQSKRPYQGKRLDKFFYTGSIESLAVNEAQDVNGKVGRFGIGLKTKIGTNYNTWVSDHFGITVVLQVL